MPAQVVAEMVNLDEFQAQLKRIGKAASEQTLVDAVTAALLLVQNSAKEKAPKLTRTLSRSIHIEILERSPTKAEGAVGTNVVYGPIQEFGGVITPKKAKALHWVSRQTGEDVFAQRVQIPAHPYLRPAWDENLKAMIETVKKVIIAAIKAAL